MNLLGAASYDPSVAVSKATSSLLAMTALDTTNLRVAVTIPAHGKIYVRMMCTITGATTLPVILLGVLNGATVVGRVSPQIFTGTNSAATQTVTAFAEFVISGLTPGAMSLDAAYAVQVIVASTNIKFGGPNNASGADAWGAFVFEVWDPQPMPVAIAPGAAGGLLIAGANAASTFATLTVTGALTINGTSNVAQTGDSFARLGAPAGASVSADIAAVQADTNDLQTRLPAALTVGGNMKADTLAVSGTAQTARDLGANVLVAGDFSATMKTSLNAATPSVTVSDKTGFVLAQAFPTNFAALGISVGGHISNVDTLTTYTGNTVQTGDSFARLGAPAGASHAADVAAVKTDTGAIKTQTDKFAFTVANQVDANVIDWKSATAPAMTGDAFARLGAPAGASVSADIAAVKAAELTAAQIATGVWTDATAGDFTAALSIGKSVMNGTALGTGLHIALADTVTTYTGNTPQTGDSFGRIGAAGAGLTALGDTRIAHLDADVSSRLATSGYTAPDNADITSIKATLGVAGAGLTALGDTRIAHLDADVSSRSTFAGGAVASVTAAVTVSGDFSATMKISLNAATPSVTVSDKTGFVLAQAFPTNFVALGISVGGHISNVDTLTTYTGNTPQTGDSFTRIGAAGAGLTALGDTRLAHLDADVSTRLATSGYTAPDNADITSIKGTIGIAGAGLTALGDTRLAHLDADVSSRLATGGYTAPDNADIASIKSTIGIAGAGLTALGDARLAHLDADVSSRLATSGYTVPPTALTIAADVWDVALASHLTSGTTGAALNGAGAAGDPWTTTLPGAYGVGTAGNIVGNNLDAMISSRLAAVGYTAPDNADIASIKSTIGAAGAGLTALGDTRLAHLDADVSSRLATGGYTAPDNADIASIKSTIGVAGAGLTAVGDARLAHLDADVSSRLPTSSYTAPDNADIAAIRAKTDNLPVDPADASIVAAAFSAVASEISGIPVAPSAVAVANEVATRTLKANVKEVNDTAIVGDGAGTPWGPV